MILVSVLYPNTPGTHFDEGYYMAKHIPLVRERWSGLGLQDVRVLKALGTPDGGAAPYRVTALLTFDSTEALQRCSEAHGPEIFGDIPNFTDGKPVMQVSEPAG
jgi:uncharacterized protein (TIGR02118 family)